MNLIILQRLLVDMELPEDEWKKKLTAEQYRILRDKGTERPFTGELVDHFEDGIYQCAGCETPLFDSNTKYDSSCGWPSFFQELDDKNIETLEDTALGMVRIEALCKNCGGHLGHIF